MGFVSILWQEYILFKRKFWSITIGFMIAPVLYLIAFGWGLGGGMRIDGKDYINFVIPGIVALSTITVSFNTTGIYINISRIYDKTFEQFMVAPINMFVYAAGKILAGTLRGMYSGLLILFLTLIFKRGMRISAYFILLMILNCLVFSAMGFMAGIMINSHADMAKFSNFVITPMAFLCGTFFPLEKMPESLKVLILLLPLTHTTLGLRSNSEDLATLAVHPLILFSNFLVFFLIGVRYCKKAE